MFGRIEHLDQELVDLVTLEKHPGEGGEKEIMKKYRDERAVEGVGSLGDPEEEDQLRREEIDTEIEVNDVSLGVVDGASLAV